MRSALQYSAKSWVLKKDKKLQTTKMRMICIIREKKDTCGEDREVLDKAGIAML